MVLSVLFAVVGVEGRENDPEPAEKQVVFETSLGTFVVDLFPEAAPNHVHKFTERVESGFYVGTTFHRAIPRAIIQGGDPLTRDPSERDRFGTGGLHELQRENSPLSHVRGTLSAVLVPADPDSAGSQFFICVTDQVQLDGQFTAYGRVAEGMDVVEKISQLETDERERIRERVEILRTGFRDRPPPPEIPFEAATVEQLARQRAVIHTDLGEIELAFYAEDAPEHVRQFLKFARLGLYDGTPFHRVSRGFVVQGGSLALRDQPVPAEFQDQLKPLQLEVSPGRNHVRGAVAMARGEEPDSAMDSFFILLDDHPGLDGIYTVFGHVVRGMEVVDEIAAQPVEEETPVDPLRKRIKVREAGGGS